MRRENLEQVQQYCEYLVKTGLPQTQHLWALGFELLASMERLYYRYGIKQKK